MPLVTLALGTPTHFSAGSWVQWDERTTGFGDLSAFADPAGETRALIRLRVFRNGGIRFQVIDVPDGGSGFGSSEQLTDLWEGYAQALVISAAGVSPDRTCTGPTNADSPSTDSTEPYAWTPANASAQATWFDAYETAGRPAVTLTVSDGQTVVTNRDAGISARAGSPTAAIGAQAQAITTRDAGISARAGSPTAAIGAQAQAITTRDAGISARAGSPTAAIGASALFAVETLLPPHATELELALEAASAPDHLDPSAIRDLWDPEECPLDWLPWLAWALGVRYWDPSWTEAVKRQVVGESIETLQKAGTLEGMRYWPNIIGYPLYLTYWHQQYPEGEAGTAVAEYGYIDTPPSDAVMADLEALVEGMKRLSLHLTHQPVSLDDYDETDYGADFAIGEVP